MSASGTLFIRGACPHDCPDTCAVITEVRNGKAVGFKADPDHHVTRGWLCAKVRPYLDRVYHPDRLTHPLRRVGPKGSGEWEQISWDEALDEIASRWKQIITEDTAAAILPYSFSGTLGLLNNAVAAERFWRRLGATELERSICGAAAEKVVQVTYGGRHAPDPSHLDSTELIIIWGHNPASTSPHFMPFLQKAQRNGTRLIVIDPRRTITARRADLHLQPRPATDGALALGLMNVIFSEGLHDEAWLEAHSVGWRELRERAADYPVDEVASITGLPAETIINLAREFATADPAILKFADGVQRHGNGGQTARALCCLPAIAGHVGKRGGGLWYSTSDYVVWDGEALSHASDCEDPPRIVNINRLGAALTGEANDPTIRSLFVFCANPVTSSPNAGKIVEGLLRDDLFTVVHDLFMTDTARYADIVLPATSQLEQVDLHKPYGHRHLQYNNQAIEPLGESMSNWDLFRKLSERMGFTDPWLHQSSEEVIEEILEASRPANPTLTGITMERLQSEGTVALHLPDGIDTVPYADGHFPTPSGKVELLCMAMEELGADPLPEYVVPEEFQLDNGADLVMISGAAHHYVSSSLANQPKLMALEGKPYIEINPEDARARNITDGQTVRIENHRGWLTLRAIVTGDVPSGVVVAPKGGWAQNNPGERNVNWVTSDATADIVGQSTFHSNKVRVLPAD